MSNPFRVQGVVRPPYFTNRSEELERITAALRSPGSKLLVYGERRLGKTSTLVVARERVQQDGLPVVLADFSTASSVADLAHRLIRATGEALSSRWQDWSRRLVERLRISVRLEPDPTTGLAVPVVGAELRDQPPEQQYETLTDLLDTIDTMAAERESSVAVILDEFQEIHRLGGERAEWRLRSVLQHHEHTSYVLSGSRMSLIRSMVGRERALYKLVDLLRMGPLPPIEFAGWIEERMEVGGRPCRGLGEACLRAAGPRTRDVVQLARRCFDIGPDAAGGDPRALVQQALREIVAEEEDLARVVWDQCTANQQKVLRAVAAAEAGITTEQVRTRFNLPQSGTVSNTVGALVDEGVLVRTDATPGYDFDSPFVRGWVILHPLADHGASADLLERPAAREYMSGSQAE